MPSEVYLRTRDALATLVSERAATRVLNAALRRASVSADSLDASAVRELLTGPVQRELEGILPRAGLRRTLRRLARQVADAAPNPGHQAGAVPAATPRPSEPTAPRERHAEPSASLHPVRRSSVYLPDVAVPGDPDVTGRDPAASPSASSPNERDPRSWDGPWPDDGRADDVAPALASAAVAAEPERHAGLSHATRSRPAGTAAQAARPTVVPQALPPEALDRLTVRFAEIEGVTQVIGLRDRNDPPQVRGEGIDPDALAPLARSAIRLLGRHGPLRSLVLEHPDGLLFIFPLGRDAVAVLAGTDVNMGAVFAARAALEEAQ